MASILSAGDGRNLVQDDIKFVEVVRPDGRSPIVLVCEHASPYIPASFQDLGVSPAARVSHVAWDLGAMAVARAMSRILDATLVSSQVSRLVYDCNRPPDAPDRMPTHSEAYAVPGNRDLTEAEKRAREARSHARELLLDDGARLFSSLRRLAFETVAQRGHIFPRIAVDEQVVGTLGRRGPDPQSVLPPPHCYHSFHGHEGNRAALSVLGLERRRPLQVPPPQRHAAAARRAASSHAP